MSKTSGAIALSVSIVLIIFAMAIDYTRDSNAVIRLSGAVFELNAELEISKKAVSRHYHENRVLMGGCIKRGYILNVNTEDGGIGWIWADQVGARDE